MKRFWGGAMSAWVCLLGTPAWAFDADSDQVRDEADAYPCEGWAVAAGFHPAQGDHGLLFFEDNFPINGDLDFNDAVITYNYIFQLDAQGRVVSLKGTFNALALGGTYNLGLGLHLPVSRDSVQVATRTIGTGSATYIEASATDSDATFWVLPELRQLFGGRAGPINALPSEPQLAGDVLEFEVLFTSPVVMPLDQAPYDLFVFHSEDTGREIHMPQFAGTSRMNAELFGSGDDGSSAMRRFVNQEGLPFTLQFPTLVAYPREGVEISNLYPNILPFAASGGLTNRDFYVSGVMPQFAYRDVTGQPSLAPRFIGPDYVPARTGCIQHWGLAVEWGTSRSVYAYASALDDSGNAVVGGYTESAFPTQIHNGAYDAFVAKYDSATGLELWVRQIGSSADDSVRDLKVDATGNIYVVGDASGALAGQPFMGETDVFVAKYDAVGNLTWLRMLGGTGRETGYGLALDAEGNIYIGGGSASMNLPGTTYPGQGPASFVAKFDNDGNRLWTQQYLTDPVGLGNFSYTLDVTVDPLTGAVYSVGAERRNQTTGSGIENQYVARHDGEDGHLIWVRHIGEYGYRSTSTDYRYGFAYGVAVDDFDGSAFVTGYWYAGQSITEWGAWRRAAGDTSADTTITKFSPGGETLWSYTLASEDRADDFGEAVIADGRGGTVYFTGRTLGTLPGEQSRGGDDYYVAAYTYEGTARWLEQFGTYTKDAGHIAATISQSQNSGVVYVIGNTIGGLRGPDGWHWDVAFYRHDLDTGANLSTVFARQHGWRAGPFGACSVTCGEGIKIRNVWCEYADGSLAPNATCPGTPPPTDAACEWYSGCNHDWVASDWSACSAACGAGLQTRTLQCMRSDGSPQPDWFCDVKPRPDDQRECSSTAACTYAWTTTEWSACSLTGPCTVGTQSRTVLCQRSDGASVADSFCTGARPALTNTCVDPTCNTPESCASLYAQGQRTSGRYDIDSDGPGGAAPINVYCHMDAQGGWTNINLSSNQILLSNNNSIRCQGGLTATANAITCNQPIFNDNPAAFLYHYRCDGTDRSAHYLLDHAAPILGHAAFPNLGFTALAQQYGSGNSNNGTEYCYVNGNIYPWNNSNCFAYSNNANGNCIPGYFTLCGLSAVRLKHRTTSTQQKAGAARGRGPRHSAAPFCGNGVKGSQASVDGGEPRISQGEDRRGTRPAPRGTSSPPRSTKATDRRSR